MCPEPAYRPDVHPGAALEWFTPENVADAKHHSAGNATYGVESSRFAAPSLRYGPSGDTTPPVAQRSTMAESELPAMTDRRTHCLARNPCRRELHRPP